MWRMRYFLLIFAVVALVGCGKKEDPASTAPSSPKTSAETKEAQVNTNRKPANTPPDIAEATDLRLEKVLVEDHYYDVSGGKIEYTDRVRRTLSLQEFGGSVSRPQSRDGCEGSREPHAVKGAIAQGQSTD